MDDILGVPDFSLSPIQLEEIAGFTDFRLGFPWEFLHEPYILELVHGKSYPDLEFTADDSTPTQTLTDCALN